MADARFKPGHDPRRAAAGPGRPVSPATIARAIRLHLGRDVAAIVDNVAVLARSGDPQGLLAAAILLAGVMHDGGNTGMQQYANTEAQKPV